MSEGIEKLGNEALEKVAAGGDFYRWYYTVKTNGALYAVLLNDHSKVIDRVANGATVVSTGHTRNGPDARGNPCLLRYVQTGGGAWGWMSDNDLCFDHVSKN